MIWFARFRPGAARCQLAHKTDRIAHFFYEFLQCQVGVEIGLPQTVDGDIAKQLVRFVHFINSFSLSQSIKRGLLTSDQAAKGDALKSASPDFTVMRRLAMRVRGILQSKDIQKFDVWLVDAQQSAIYAIHRFARTLRRDVDAVRDSLTERWSNGQIQEQINRLKTLKRAMYGRASTELLRARMLPLHLPTQHGKCGRPALGSVDTLNLAKPVENFICGL